MLLASFNTLPLVNLKPELGKSGIGGIGIAGKWVADMLGVFFFFVFFSPPWTVYCM